MVLKRCRELVHVIRNRTGTCLITVVCKRGHMQEIRVEVKHYATRKVINDDNVRFMR